jgi:selenocysteine lyase/cysteine desulfurase
MSKLEAYFDHFRTNVIGNDQTFEGPYGKKTIIYADWMASGRLYRPIEQKLIQEVAPFVGNTHTETTITGCAMTLAYQKAKMLIKKHVGARSEDILVATNSGMTGVVNKFQRILGLKIHERYYGQVQLKDEERPVIFISHMEHHSNQTSWLETLADVEIIKPSADGLMDLANLDILLDKYASRKTKIAAITSCSNVTGIQTPYYQVAERMHRAGGLCFVDFAASAPYIDIDMHPVNPLQALDAIYFSPHKFLGGPGSSGVLIFHSKLYKNKIPDNPGGGTVDWTNPWGEHKYHDAIEAREDGGTPAFLQTIKVALAILLKNEMGVKNILAREHEILKKIWRGIEDIPGLHILASRHRNRLGVISFYIVNLHYNLAVKLLNDRFGIQTRGGCSCAGTYGHYLLHVTHETSEKITSKINLGDLSEKPGWIRLSIHPVLTDSEVDQIIFAIVEVARHFRKWQEEYNYDAEQNEFVHHSGYKPEIQLVSNWFSSNILATV